MTLNKKLILPIVIIVACSVLVYFITANPPEAQRRLPSSGPQITVETVTITEVDYSVILNSFGIVQPRTQSNLVAQVGGQITKVSEQFSNGSFFEKGDPLVWLDKRDYAAEVKIAQANVLSGQQQLLEEKARGEQALVDWDRLGDGSQPNALVLRKPQLEAAKAVLLSAEAQLQKAELALERTTIQAPYAGRILNIDANIGQVVNSNAPLASIYAIDVVEVRLPINNNDLPFIDLPKQFRGNTVVNGNTQVLLHSDLVGDQSWLAKIVRTEGAINSDSQQLYVVAQIEDPYSELNEQKIPIKIGQYVNADITGKPVSSAIVIPNSAIYQGSYVYTVVDDALLRKDIKISWQNAEEAIIASGLSSGEALVLTTLGQVSSGTKVQLQEPVSDNNQTLSSKPSPYSNEPSKNDNRRPKRLSPQDMEALAKERGITVEELKEERRKRRPQ